MTCPITENRQHPPLHIFSVKNLLDKCPSNFNDKQQKLLIIFNYCTRNKTRMMYDKIIWQFDLVCKYCCKNWYHADANGWRMTVQLWRATLYKCQRVYWVRHRTFIVLPVAQVLSSNVIFHKVQHNVAEIQYTTTTKSDRFKRQVSYSCQFQRWGFMFLTKNDKDELIYRYMCSCLTVE